MRSVIFIVALFLSVNWVYASEESQVEIDESPVQVDEAPVQGDDIAVYCDEQAQLADIAVGNEKKEFMRDCIASFTTQYEQ